MKGTDATRLVVESAQSLLAALARVTDDQAERLDALLRAIDDGMAQINALIDQADQLDENEPGEREERYCREQTAAIVKISAAAMAILVLLPVERELLGKILPIVARPGNA